MSLTPNGLIMLQKSAKNGNQYAQFDLAVMYANGDCVSKDETKAAEWYEKAAIQGNKFAQFNLGVVAAISSGDTAGDEAMDGAMCDRNRCSR